MKVKNSFSCGGDPLLKSPWSVEGEKILGKKVYAQSVRIGIANLMHGKAILWA